MDQIAKTRKPQQTIKSSSFWQESKVAVWSGKYEKFWDLSVGEKAWLIAAYETESEIQQVVDFIADMNSGE